MQQNWTLGGCNHWAERSPLLGFPLLKHIKHRHINNLYNDHSEKNVSLFFKCFPFMTTRPQGI